MIEKFLIFIYFNLCILFQSRNKIKGTYFDLKLADLNIHSDPKWKIRNGNGFDEILLQHVTFEYQWTSDRPKQCFTVLPEPNRTS